MPANGKTKVQVGFAATIADAASGDLYYGFSETSDTQGYVEVPWTQGTGTDQFDEAVMHRSAGLTGSVDHDLQAFADHGRTVAFAELREIYVRNLSTPEAPATLRVGGGTNAVGVLANVQEDLGPGDFFLRPYRNDGFAPVVAATGDILRVEALSGATCPYVMEIKGVTA